MMSGNADRAVGSSCKVERHVRCLYACRKYFVVPCYIEIEVLALVFDLTAVQRVEYDLKCFFLNITALIKWYPHPFKFIRTVARTKT